MKCVIKILILLALTVPGITRMTAQPVKIGLLVQESGFISARQGAELAIKLANQKGGMNGRPFKLVVKGMEGPWGTGSKQAVDLIFEDEVWALAGSHDGRNAHLVEQAATKSIVVFISAWSSDPSLSQAFVPWFFNCVPDDLRQAEILMEAIFGTKKAGNVIVITDKSYESKQAYNSFLRRAKEYGAIKCIHLQYDDLIKKNDALATAAKSEAVQQVVLLCGPSAAIDIIRLKKKYQIPVQLYGSLFISNEDILTASQIHELDHQIMIPASVWSASQYSSFSYLYEKEYSHKPGMVASYSFDAMSVLIEAILTSENAEREDIQKVISSIHFEGVTGQIAFGSLGNRMCVSKVSLLKNGVPVEVKP